MPEEETPTTQTPEYVINYIVNFNNCTIDKVSIEQTGKPLQADPPPGTGG